MRVVELGVTAPCAHPPGRVALPHGLDPVADLENRLEHPESLESAQAIRLEDEADALGREMRPPLEQRHAQAGVGADGRESKAGEPAARDGHLPYLRIHPRSMSRRTTGLQCPPGLAAEAGFP